MSMLRTLTTTAAVLALSAGVASAATYTINGATFFFTEVSPPGSIPGGNDYQSDLESFFGFGNLGYGELTGVDAGAGRLFTFKGFGAESGYENTFHWEGTIGGSMTETGGPGAAKADWGTGPGPFSTVLSGMLASGDLRFSSNLGTDVEMGDPGFGFFYDLSGASKYVFFAYDDGNIADDNHDDFIVKVGVIPLPAPAFLLLGGMGVFGGMAAMRRRKEKKAA